MAVLGGGISGALIAAALKDAGVHVAIVDRLPELMSGASRWNDGKIHLGYTFTGTESRATAALMQEGAGAFRPVMERVLGDRLDAGWLGDRVIYLVDEDSMIDAEVLWCRAQAVARLVGETRKGSSQLLHVEDGPALVRLDVATAERETGQQHVVAAWRTSELHVAPRVLAERLRKAVLARDVDVARAEVVAVEQASDGWRVRMADDSGLVARVVVNCLWESRVAVDRTVDPAASSVSIRYKRALFGTGSDAIRHLSPSTRVVGRFGDIVSHPNGDAYMSWYPAGLAARSDDGLAPLPPAADPATVIRDTLRGLGLPETLLDGERDRWQVGGGYVVAHGYGDIDDPHSPLHMRDRPGVWELRPGYLTVDTGKYTLGPLMAARATAMVLRSGRIRVRSSLSS